MHVCRYKMLRRAIVHILLHCASQPRKYFKVMESLRIIILFGVLASCVLGRPDLDIDSELKLLEKYIDRSRRQTPDCGLDVVFVLDDSRSIHGPDFETQIHFLIDAIDNINVGPDATHVGVMAFSNRVLPKMVRLGQYVNDVDALQSRVGQIRQSNGDATQTHEALRSLRHEMFQDSRPGVPHVGVVITDGESTDPRNTVVEAQRTKTAGITMFAVGVGDHYDVDELRAIASDPSYVLEVRGGYSQLSRHLEQLTTLLCEVSTLPPSTTPLPCSQPMDLLFSAPDQAGIDDTSTTLEFIQETISSLVMGPASTKVGLTPRLGETQDGIALADAHQLHHLSSAIDGRELRTTDLPLQLRYILQSGFSEGRGARPDANKMAVLIVDNESFEHAETLLLAEEVRNAGVVLMTVSVGPHASNSQLRAVASQKPYQTFYSVADYSRLGTAVLPISEALCSASDE